MPLQVTCLSVPTTPTTSPSLPNTQPNKDNRSGDGAGGQKSFRQRLSLKKWTEGEGVSELGKKNGRMKKELVTGEKERRKMGKEKINFGKFLHIRILVKICRFNAVKIGGKILLGKPERKKSFGKFEREKIFGNLKDNFEKI
jgi:hypothetical protein